MEISFGLHLPRFRLDAHLPSFRYWTRFDDLTRVASVAPYLDFDHATIVYTGNKRIDIPAIASSILRNERFVTSDIVFRGNTLARGVSRFSPIAPNPKLEGLLAGYIIMIFTLRWGSGSKKCAF